MKEYQLILFILIASVSFGQKKTKTSETYDVVILNGRVIDSETTFDDIAYEGIKDGKIAIITKSKIKGKETIDAIDCTGLTNAKNWI